MTNANYLLNARRLPLAGLAALILAGCAAATDVPTGMGHPADSSAAAGKMPHGDMNQPMESRSMEGMDGHDMSSMDRGAPAMDGDHEHDHEARVDIDRVVELAAIDTDFEPKSIRVRAGETIRFVVTNDGAVDHEFVIGDGAAQAAHAEQMAAAGTTMGHGHVMANAMSLKPGETKEIVWTFEAGQDLEFACHIPGHYEAGMWGKIEIDS